MPVVEYKWTDNKAYIIDQELWQAYLNEDIKSISDAKLQYLSNFTRKDYIDTVATIYAWTGIKDKAKKYAKQGLEKTKLRVKLLLKMFPPREVEKILQKRY